jgi:hypothetical protein
VPPLYIPISAGVVCSLVRAPASPPDAAVAPGASPCSLVAAAGPLVAALASVAPVAALASLVAAAGPLVAALASVAPVAALASLAAALSERMSIKSLSL